MVGTCLAMGTIAGEGSFQGSERAEAGVGSFFTGLFSAPVMYTDMSQVGVTLFPSF